MKMKKYEVIEKYLDELIPNPKCELNYFNDYSLLIAIMLSAQTTDKRVNEVTKVLFEKYKFGIYQKYKLRFFVCKKENENDIIILNNISYDKKIKSIPEIKSSNSKI